MLAGELSGWRLAGWLDWLAERMGKDEVRFQ